MLYPDSVVLGTATKFSAVFLDLANNPIIGDSPATWVIKAPNGDIILSGVGAQENSTLNPEKWSSWVTLPTTAPITSATQRYTLIWSITSNGVVNTSSNTFKAVTGGDVVPFERDIMVRHATTFVIKSPSGLPSTLQIWPPYQGVAPEDSLIPVFSSTSQATSFTIPGGLNASGDVHGAIPYVAVWTWSDNGTNFNEMQMIYVLSLNCVMFINDMRRDLDKARNYDINPALQFSDIDMLHYALQGFFRLNSMPPQISSFTIENCPPEIKWPAKMCGLVEAARAQWLAESISGNFEFTGMSTTLSVDRSAAWQAFYESVNGGLDELVGRLKRQLANKLAAGSNFMGQIGGGALGITMGPSTNMLMTYSNSWVRSRLVRFSG